MTVGWTVAAAQLTLTFLSRFMAIASFLSRRFGLADSFVTCRPAAGEPRLTAVTVTFTSY
jgi:hypothetical protein